MDTPNETHMRHVSEWQNPKPIENMEEFITRILYSLFRDAIREGAVSVVIQQDLEDDETLKVDSLFAC